MRKKHTNLRHILRPRHSSRPKSDDEEDRGGAGRSGGTGGRRTPPQGTAWSDAGGSSILVEESRTMDRQRRLQEQQGHRYLAKVNAREHSDNEHQSTPEGELQNNILQNPWLDSQRFDGVDPNLNPEPPLNTEARREYDNKRREQEMEKQLRLGNMPQFTSAPKPQGP